MDTAFSGGNKMCKQNYQKTHLPIQKKQQNKAKQNHRKGINLLLFYHNVDGKDMYSTTALRYCERKIWGL